MELVIRNRRAVGNEENEKGEGYGGRGYRVGPRVLLVYIQMGGFPNRNGI